MKLSEYLNKENNNLDLVRIIAAIAVIVGHSYALAPAEGHIDLVASLTGVMYSGSMAVSIFFFISGMVVTNSLMKKKSILEFLISRFFRIFPALFVVLVVTALIMGPLVSIYSYYDYFHNDLTYQYIYENLFMITNFNLPGVFEQNHRPSAVNGSLWTLVWEVKFYLFLLSFFLIGIFRNRCVSNLVMLLLILSPVISPLFSETNHEISYLPVMFTFGVILAFNKDYIEIDYKNFAAVVLLFLLIKDISIEAYSLALHLLLAVFTIVISSLSYVKKVKLRADISYGIYIYAWPIQQMLNFLFPMHNYLQNMIFATLLVIPLAYLSWILIEKNSIIFGRKVQAYIHNKSK